MSRHPDTPAPTVDADEVMHRGQIFRRVGTVPYTRKDGSATTLGVWRAACIICATPFEVSLAFGCRIFKPARTCPEHRGRTTWKYQLKETDPAIASRPLPDGRPVTPVDAYEGTLRK